jgi:hypothetical protein
MVVKLQFEMKPLPSRPWEMHMKATTLRLLNRSIWRRIIRELLVLGAAALIAMPAFAQHPVGGGHPVGGAHPVGPTPVPVRPAPVRSRAVVGSRVIIGPHAPVSSFGRFIGGFPEHRRHPFIPFFGFAPFFGFGLTPFWYPGCGAFVDWGYGCAAFSPEPVNPLNEPLNEYSPPENPEAENYAGGPLVSGNLAMETTTGEQLPRKFILYLKDGSVFAVSKYSVSDGKLHYVTVYGAEDSIDLDRLDVQKTIDANARRGVTFSLTTPPAAAPPANPAGSPNPTQGAAPEAAPAPAGPITPPPNL